MTDLANNIDKTQLPQHIAVIMDGNGRWAKQSGKPRIFGHRNGVKAVREVTETCAELGVKYLTLYAFSTENWNRPKLEVNALMLLLVDTVKKEMKTLMDNSIKLEAIGDISKLPSKTYQTLIEGIEQTKNNTRMTLTLALNYSSRWEILQAAKRLVNACEQGNITSDQIDDKVFQDNLTTSHMPDPELLIRTSGEHRVSNFLLWQIAYTEFHFTNVLWPDFRREHLYKAILDFQNRERRFGKTSEQLIPK